MGKYVNGIWKDEDIGILLKQIELEKEPTIQALFNGYYYIAMLDRNNGPGIVATNDKEEDKEGKLLQHLPIKHRS